MHPLLSFNAIEALSTMLRYLLAGAVVAYAFCCICLFMIAHKTEARNPWWAFIPVLNILLMLNLARKPPWWMVLMLTPMVNLVAAVLVWIEICKAREKSPWILLGLLVPIIGPLGVVGYLAFTD